MKARGNFTIRVGQTVVWKGFSFELKDSNRNMEAKKQFDFG